MGMREGRGGCSLMVGEGRLGREMGEERLWVGKGGGRIG